MRPTTTSALLVAALSASACSPTLDWREMRPEGSGMTMSFPCKPDRRARAVVVAGHAVRMQMLSCSAGDATYALTFADLPEPAAVTPALTELRALAATNIAAAPSAPAHLRVPGMTPNPQAGRIVLAGRLPDGAVVQAQAAFFSKGLRVYQASVIGTQLGDEAVDTFFAALKVQA